MISEDKLDNLLYEKMQSEYDDFLDNIRFVQGDDPDKGIDSAYEVVYKQDILFCFEDGDNGLSYAEKKMLYSKKYPLDFLYEEWQKTDCTHMQMIRDCIKDSAEAEVQRIQERNHDNIGGR